MPGIRGTRPPHGRLPVTAGYLIDHTRATNRLALHPLMHGYDAVRLRSAECLLLAAPAQTPTSSAVSSDKVAKLIGVDQLIAACEKVPLNQVPTETVDVRQLFIRQQIIEAVVSAALDVDSVCPRLRVSTLG